MYPLSLPGLPSDAMEDMFFMNQNFLDNEKIDRWRAVYAVPWADGGERAVQRQNPEGL